MNPRDTVWVPAFISSRTISYSSEYPVINAVFESHLQKVNTPQAGGFAGMQGGLSDNDKANLILKNSSFRDILEMNPASDTISSILAVKGDYLFNLLRAKAGIDEFKEWFKQYIDDNVFRSIDIRKFNDDVKERFGFEFYPYLEEWFNRKEQPGFNFGEPQVNEILVGERVRYLVTFNASNAEEVPGIFNVSFRTGGPGVSSNRVSASKLFKMIKQINPKIITLGGGIHATLLYKQVLENYPGIDFLVLSEGEETVLEADGIF